MKPLDELRDKAYIAHYGIKGMKWGVRRSQKELDRVAGRTPESYRSEDAKRASGYQKIADTKGSGALSNQELQALVNRMNLQSQYDRLTTGPTNKTASFVGGVLTQEGTKLARDIVRESVSKKVKKVLFG